MSINSGIEKIYASEGYVTISVDIFCLTVPIIYVGNPSMLCFRKFPEAKMLMDKKGGVSRVSVESFLSHFADKIAYSNHLV